MVRSHLGNRMGCRCSCFNCFSKFGDVQWTDTADSQVGTLMTALKHSMIFHSLRFMLNKIQSLNTDGIAYATPVLQNVNQIFILKTV
jgi:hypothetical protein